MNSKENKMKHSQLSRNSLLIVHILRPYAATRDDPTILFVTGRIAFFLSLLRGILSGCEYITVLITTNDAPPINSRFGRKFRNTADTAHDITMEAEAANVLSTLSAYLITTATISPPIACTTTTVHTTGEYPTKKTLFGNDRSVFDIRSDVSDDNGGKAHLYVAHPEAGGGSLEHFFEVNPRESGGASSTEDGDKT